MNKNVVYAAAGATAVALAYLAVSTVQVLRSERIEQQHLIDITNAFTQAYSEERSPDTVVPATFRRIGMDHFSTGVGLSTDTTEAAASMRMPGIPGLELLTVEEDERLRTYIASLADTPDRPRLEEFRLEDSQLIARTVVPSIATYQSCVACHNDALGENIYSVGDAMGAFVVETNLTKVFIQNALIALGAFFLVFAGTFLMARRERNRMRDVVDALTGQVEAENYANFLASHDALTGLANRKLFRDRLDAEVASFHANERTDIIALIVDADDFKTINDTMGHDAGDAVLKQIAARLSEQVESKGGMAARLGGDEFAALIPLDNDQIDMSLLGSQLIDALKTPFQHNGKKIEPKVSIGLSGLLNLGDQSSVQLLKAADLALYAAKDRGKMCFHAYDDELRAAFGRRSELAAVLPEAIQIGQVRAILQPQIDLKTNAIVGFEALARWTHNDLKISPAEFIPIAEEIGVIGELDLAVLSQAAVLVQALNAKSNRDFALSVNVSSFDLLNDDIVERIADVLLSTGFNPQHLTVEITESAFLSDWSEVNRRLVSLREMGIKIALDDFGTGYSSLSYLTQFSFDTIKVDRSFLQHLSEGCERSILLSHIVEMARSLNKTVVTEGVESMDQADYVARLGAHIGQGALYGLDIEESREWLGVFSDELKLSA